MNTDNVIFPFGLRVLLRSQTNTSELHWQDFPSATATWSSDDQPFLVILDATESVPLAMIHKDAITMILPLPAPDKAHAQD